MYQIIKQYPNLFKKDKNDKIRIWNLQAICDEDKYYIYIHYGQKDGKIIENKKEVKEGKNIGKKNETSVKQQLILVCDKTWKDKKEKELYSENLDISCKEISFFPMLADKWDINSKVKRKIDIIFPCFVQPKLDGIRCLTYIKNDKIVNQSRQLKYFTHLNHINEELFSIFKDEPNLVLDGELYNHDIEFNQISGIVKKEKLKDTDKEKLKNIQYHIYDCFFTDKEGNIKNNDFIDRYKMLEELLSLKNKYIKLVSTLECENKINISEYHQNFIEINYEGLILRNKNGKYESTRSKNLQKFKTFCDDEFEIIDYKEGSGLDSGTVIWKCKTKDGKEFDVRPKGTVDERKKLLKNGNKCIGKMLTVTYQELSEYGVPRFPVGKTIRDYE